MRGPGKTEFTTDELGRIAERLAKGGCMNCDKRDMRDPTELGLEIKDVMRVLPMKTAAEAHDYVENHSIIDRYREDGMLGAEVARAYIGELRERADNGDRFAQSSLQWYMEHGTLFGAPAEPVEA